MRFKTGMQLRDRLQFRVRLRTKARCGKSVLLWHLTPSSGRLLPALARRHVTAEAQVPMITDTVDLDQPCARRAPLVRDHLVVLTTASTCANTPPACSFLNTACIAFSMRAARCWPGQRREDTDLIGLACAQARQACSGGGCHCAFENARD